MLTMTALFDENKKAKLKELANALRLLKDAPVTAIQEVTLHRPKRMVLALARTRPIVYNEWD
jgi:hypothetical protein